MICIICDTKVVENLIRTNLGPLINTKDHIYCSRTNTGTIECDVYAPWKTSRTCCKQLEDTFTVDAIVDVLGNEVTNIKIDCQLPTR